MIEFISGCYQGQRKINQDYCKSFSDEDITIAIVADGLGAYKGSEVASEAFSEIFVATAIAEKHLLVENPEHMYDIVFDSASKTIGILLHNQLVEACTAFASVIETKDYTIKCHVGDCRIYSMNNQDDIIHTLDHSVTSNLNNNKLDDEASFIPHSGILTNVIGPSTEINPDISVTPKYKDSVQLVCSDGFWEHLSLNFLKKFYNSKEKEEKEEQVLSYTKMLVDNELDRDNYSYLLFKSEF